MVRSTATEHPTDAQAYRRAAVVLRVYRRDKPVHLLNEGVAVEPKHIFSRRQFAEGDIAIRIRRGLDQRDAITSRIVIETNGHA